MKPVAPKIWHVNPAYNKVGFPGRHLMFPKSKLEELEAAFPCPYTPFIHRCFYHGGWYYYRYSPQKCKKHELFHSNSEAAIYIIIISDRDCMLNSYWRRRKCRCKKGIPAAIRIHRSQLRAYINTNIQVSVKYKLVIDSENFFEGAHFVNSASFLEDVNSMESGNTPSSRDK